MNLRARFLPCPKYSPEKPAARSRTTSRSSPETNNWDTLSNNARPHLDGTQSNHVSPARLPAVLPHPYFLRAIQMGASDSCRRGIDGRNRRIAGANAQSEIRARRLSRSDCRQTFAFFFFRNSGDGEKSGVVADDHGAQPRRFAPRRRRGDYFNFRLSPVSAQPLRKIDDVFSDCFCFRRGPRGGFSLPALDGSESRLDLHGDGVHRFLRLPLLLRHRAQTQRLTDRIAKMQQHQNKTCGDGEAGEPAENLRAQFFRVVHRLAIHEKFAEQESRGQAAGVRSIVDSDSTKNSEREKKNERAYQTRAQVFHVRAAAFRGDGKNCADDAKQCAARAERQMSAEGAEEKSDGSRDGVKKQKTRRAVQFFKGRAELHQVHHIEADVNQSAVQEHGGDEAPPLMLRENRLTETCAEAEGRNSVEAPENTQAAGGTGLDGEHQLDGEEQKIQTEKDGRDRRFEVRYDGNFLGDGGEREAQARAAFVAAGGADADERAARGTKLRARRPVAAARKAAQRFFPALEARLPAIGKCHRVSLRRTGQSETRLLVYRATKCKRNHYFLAGRSVRSYNTEIALPASEYGEIWTNLKKCAGIWMKD